MKKLREILQKLNLRYFFREVLIVMTGVTVTILVTERIANNNRESEVRVSVELVRDELSKNIEEFDAVKNVLQINVNGAEFLKQNAENIDKMNPDTLKSTIEKLLQIQRTKYNDYAKDVLRSHADRENISNELLVYICSIYGKCTEVEKMINGYFDTTSEIYDQATEQLYIPGKPRPSGHEIYNVLSRNGKFRVRIFNPNHIKMYADLISETQNDLMQCVNKLDKLIENDEYKTFKF